MVFFFRDGGLVMFPTLFFGFLLMASSVLSLRQPERRWLTFVFGALTTSSGILGTAMGLINTMKYAAHNARADERLSLIAEGTAESLNNMVLAMILVMLALLVSAVAAFRTTRAGPKEA